jgi:hypothetical protein
MVSSAGGSGRPADEISGYRGRFGLDLIEASRAGWRQCPGDFCPIQVMLTRVGALSGFRAISRYI